MISRPEVRSLRDTIEQARIVLTTSLPPAQTRRVRELLESAICQADALIAKPTVAMLAHKGHAKVTVKGNPNG